MTELDDIEALAAEYVLGTLEREQRAIVAARRATDPALAAAIAAWETRLAPLAETVTPIDPPADLYDRISAGIGPAARVLSFKTREQTLERQANRWRAAAAAMTALAASLAAVVGWQLSAPSERPAQYVAVLQTAAEAPAFLLSVDTEKETFVIAPVAAPKQPDKAYELWLIAGSAAPRSLGVISDAGTEAVPLSRAAVGSAELIGATYAVSLEPAGGSPTGAPTGPVMFTGKLYKAPR